ncbi:MAG TPA: circadian clock protein KaiC [Burkholderiales bacterium]|nr:circadian clock protein KaiC [Burkholderiales bacterium]
MRPSKSSGGAARAFPRRLLPKAKTGIAGLDEITGGGLPKGRPTLVCGGPGCGKTMLAMEFLVRGATEFQEPGVFMSFEETADDLVQNVASMGFDLNALQARKKIFIDEVRVARSEIHETGEYDLEALFIRLGHAIDSVGAKRVVLDTLEALFGGFSNATLLRAELRRLFDWLKERNVTAIITGERGQGQLTRQGLEEYVSDCVILLDHRVANQLTIRRMRIVKYRGSVHGTDEYPFLIAERGISVLPITSLGLSHRASSEILSSGIEDLDPELGGGFYSSSSVLVSGLAGTGKSTFAAHFAAGACARKDKSLYVAMEQSPDELLRNTKGVGLPLKRHVASGFLKFHALRPTAHGLELHLTTIHRLVEEFEPRVVIVDAISSFIGMGINAEVTSMLVRLIDFLKTKQITLYMTSLNETGEMLDRTGANISSVVDAWLLLRNVERNSSRVRTVSILKSRGMAHSTATHPFSITSRGILLESPLASQGAP